MGSLNGDRVDVRFLIEVKKQNKTQIAVKKMVDQRNFIINLTFRMLSNIIFKSNRYSVRKLFI